MNNKVGSRQQGSKTSLRVVLLKPAKHVLMHDSPILIQRTTEPSLRWLIKFVKNVGQNRLKGVSVKQTLKLLKGPIKPIKRDSRRMREVWRYGLEG